MTYIPENSFYRNLPKVLNARQRLRNEVLIYASDAIEVAFQRIQDRALTLPVLEISRSDRMSFMMDAWSIVDHVHVARQMIKRLTKKETRPPQTSDYISNYEAATFMRNKMDHLDGTIGNRASSKSIRTAMFGALTYLRPDLNKKAVSTEDNEIFCDAVVIMIGSVPSGLRRTSSRQRAPIFQKQSRTCIWMPSIENSIFKARSLICGRSSMGLRNRVSKVSLRLFRASCMRVVFRKKNGEKRPTRT